MAYIGAQPNKTLTQTTSQSFNGTGSATAFTLNRAVNTGEELEVFVDNVQQEPGSGKSYTATGTTLTFDEAPPSGTGNVYVIYRGQAEVTTRLEAPDLSITTAKIADDAVTTAKIADANITTAKIADNAVTAAKLPTGSVVQVVQDVSTTFFGPNSGGGSYQDTGHSVTITPSSSSNKVMFTFSAMGIIKGCNHGGIRLLRGTTDIHRHEFYSNDSSYWQAYNFGFSYLDSPNTTSAVTYKIQAYAQTLTSSQQLRINYQSIASGNPNAICLVQEIVG